MIKIECDRCAKLTGQDSLNGKDFRIAQIGRRSTGGATAVTASYDLCRECTTALENWLLRPIQKA
jgi:hypothetical protein